MENWIATHTDTKLTSTHTSTRVQEKCILKDLVKVDIPDYIKKEAQNVYQRIGTPTHRGLKRQLMIFFCIACAYFTLRIPFLPKILGQKLGIKSNKLNKSISMFKDTSTGYRPPIVHYEPRDFIPIILKELEISEEIYPVMNISNMTDMLNEILEKKPYLKEIYPQNVAAGFVLYYMLVNGVRLHETKTTLKHLRSEFSQKIVLSEITTNNIMNKIAKAYNENN